MIHYQTKTHTVSNRTALTATKSKIQAIMNRGELRIVKKKKYFYTTFCLLNDLNIDLKIPTEKYYYEQKYQYIYVVRFMALFLTLADNIGSITDHRVCYSMRISIYY